jgi:NADH:ubiquinone oxidoreductase subunit 3 (subunit A)
MKLNLLFIVMDLLTLLVYPIVFAHGKIRQFSRPKAVVPVGR